VEDFKEETDSMYNEAGFQISRLNNNWMLANYHSRTGNFKEWHWTLDVIWRELSSDAMKKVGGKLDPSKFNELSGSNPWFVKFDSLTNKILSARNSGDRQREYQSLSNLDIFLRGLQQAVGKGSKWKDPGEDSIL
jgi:hypothetical protein